MEESVKRSEVREWVMKLIYSMDINNTLEAPSIASYVEKMELDDTDGFISNALHSIVLHREELDNRIDEHLKGWQIERLARVDHAILRVAVNEMLYNPQIPVSVSINEAIELSKKYGQDESYRYINGVLGAISKQGDGQ